MLNLKTLSLADSRKIASAASVRAQAEGWKVVIAVHDCSGHLICLERADGALIGSIQVAQEKARAALYFRQPTKVFEDMIQSGRVNMITLSGSVSIEGGLPLIKDGEVVGSIGVSGVQSHQDGAIAAAGAEAMALL